jgi:hypothetical protein
MANYAKITNGTGAVYKRDTFEIVPEDEFNKERIAYNTWLAVPNVADADIESLEGARDRTRSIVNQEAEIELVKWRPMDSYGALTTLDFDTARSEAAAATLEGTPWAAGYPFLEEQIGIHGADTGAVATYWTGQWDAYVLQAKLIEAQREQYLVDITAAANFAAVTAIRNAINWPNVPEPDPNPLTLGTPDPTLDGPTAIIAITPDASPTALAATTTTVDIPIQAPALVAGPAVPEIQIIPA